jgi:predicted small secreted protein
MPLAVLATAIVLTACSATGAGVAGETAIDAGNDSVSGSPAEPNATPRTKLAATDPATVRLATGSPQLIEFFAHW